MISSLPKLRSDLDLRQQTTATGTALVIKDPASGQSFRLQEAEQFIAEQLDGNTPVEVVRHRAEEKLGASLAPETLAGFIQTLGRNGLLESNETGESQGPGQRWWLGQKASTTSNQPELRADSVWGKYFRLRAAEYFLVRQLQADTPVDNVGRVEQDLATTPAPKATTGRIKDTKGNGPLESDEIKAPRKSAGHRRRRGKASSPSTEPKLQTEPEVRKQQTVEGTTSVLKDPASGDSVRPAAAEDPAAVQVDDATPGPIVQQRAEQDITSPAPTAIESTSGPREPAATSPPQREDRAVERRAMRIARETPLPAAQGEEENGRRSGISRDSMAVSPAPEAPAGFIKSTGGDGRPESGGTREPGESGLATPARQEASTTPSQPKLRTDLTVSKQGTAGEAIFVVKDPVTGQFFRLREAEWFIAGQCDGTTALDVIRQRTENEFGAALPLEGLTAFVKNLEKAGLLESERTVRRHRERQRRIRGSLLYLRVKLLDPDRLLDRLVGKVRFCFTPYFVVFAAALILLAAGIVATNLAEIGQGFGGLRSLLAIPVFLAVIFVVISAHEFAHGLTCKHFGGEVREMGFLLIYFQPALYCNVSDAWLFPEKSKRLWVGFAGPYFELFLWSLATVAWRLTEVGTWVNYVAFIVLVSSGIKTLFNFNPLIKLDGYYLLSDYLGIPNLRKKSFRYIGNWIKKLCGVGSQTAQAGSSRERKIYLTYGLVATLGSFSVLGLAAAKIGSFLIDQSQSLAFVLFSALLGTKLRRRFRKFFGRSSGPSDLSDDDDDDNGDFDSALPPSPAESRKREPAEPENEPEKIRPMESKKIETSESSKAEPVESRKKDPAAPIKTESEPKRKELAASGKAENAEAVKTEPKKKRKRRALKRRIALAALAGLAVAVLFLGRMELRIVGGFNVLPRENADVRSAVAGIIQEIYVNEGDEVKAGDMIARLSDRDLLAELGKTEAQINQTRANLQMLEAGPTPDEIEVAKAAVVGAEDRLKYAKSQLARDRSLFEQSLLSQAAFEATQEKAVTAQNDLVAARGKLNVLLNGSRPEEIDATRAAVDLLETQRRYLEEQLQLLKVVSPAAGIVATPSRQLKEMKRQLVNKGDLIAKVYDFKTVTAEMIIPEKEIADIKVGQEVALKARSYPDETFYGKVISIATAAQGSSSSVIGQTPAAPTSSGSVSASSKTILVTTEIDNRSLLLKAQMTGQAKIYCGQRRIFDLVTRRLARTVKVEFWSWW